MKKFLALFLFISMLYGSYEEPNYHILFSKENSEIRKYEPFVVAEFQVTDSRKEGLKNGFKVLARYIFGENNVQRKLTMTAPVMELAVDSQEDELKAKKWLVRYILPKNILRDDVPKPNNPQIKLKDIPSATYAVIRYSGRTGDENVRAQMAKLEKFIVENKLKRVGPSIFAYYNPPWTLPFLRRNEIMVKVEKL